MTRVTFRPAAAADVHDAYRWYESRRGGLGDEFLAEVQSTLDSRTAMMGWVDREILLDRFVCWGYVIRDRGPVFWAEVLDENGQPDTTSPFPVVALKNMKTLMHN